MATVAVESYQQDRLRRFDADDTADNLDFDCFASSIYDEFEMIPCERGFKPKASGINRDTIAVRAYQSSLSPTPTPTDEPQVSYLAHEHVPPNSVQANVNTNHNIGPPLSSCSRLDPKEVSSRGSVSCGVGGSTNTGGGGAAAKVDHDMHVWVANINQVPTAPQSRHHKPQQPSSQPEQQAEGKWFSGGPVAAVMEQLSEAELQRVTRFFFPADQRRALLSVLLQRALVRHCHTMLGHRDFELLRTPEGKPYLHILPSTPNPPPPPTAPAMAAAAPPAAAPASATFAPVPGPSWNFNASHHGDFVCIASHPQHLVGVDVVDLETSLGMASSADEFFDMFRQQLTPAELRHIRSQPSQQAATRLFFLYWSVKEAFIKAVGQGLGFNLLAAEFHIEVDDPLPQGQCRPQPPLHRTTAACGAGGLDGSESAIRATATLRLHGELRSDWRFDLQSLDGPFDCAPGSTGEAGEARGRRSPRHVLCVARGPLAAAIPSFRQALAQTQTQTQKQTQTQTQTQASSRRAESEAPPGVVWSDNSPTCSPNCTAEQLLELQLPAFRTVTFAELATCLE